MNPQVNYLAVGVFLLLGLAGLVTLIIWLGQVGDSSPKAQYIVQIDGEVNGLSNGSVVSYLGVNVGTVVDIQLHAQRMPLVEVYIDIQQHIPINESTFATLVVQGVTGIANLDLGSDPSRALPLSTHPSGLPVIPFRASGLAAMLAASGDLGTDARRLLVRLNAWVGEENRARVEEILENVRLLSAAAAERRDDIPEIIVSLKATIKSLERTSKGLEVAVGEDWPVIAADLKATGASLASASARVDRWLDANDENVDRMLGEGLDSISGLAVDLRDVAEQLSRLSARLREDPSRLIYRAQHDPVVAEP